MLLYNLPAEQIMAELKRAYGGREWMVSELAKKIQGLKKMTSITDPSLLELSSQLNMFVAAMHSQGFAGELTNLYLVKSVNDKLHELHEREWRRLCNPNEIGIVALLATFINERVNDFPPEAYEQHSAQRPKQPGESASRRVLAHQQVAAKNENSERKLSCYHCCEQGHAIYYCDPFKKLSISDRYQAVRDKKLCTCCLASSSHAIHPSI